MNATQAETYAHLIRSGVGKRTAEFIAAGQFDETRSALKAARAFVLSKDITLTLLGNNGGGKTVAASTVLLASVVRYGDPPQEAYDGAGARYIIADDLCRASYYEAETARTIRVLSEIRWLVIDELGSELATDAWMATLYRIIQARNENGNRTVLAANVTPDVFAAKYGNRIVDRIKTDGAVVVCEPDSLRKRTAAELADETF